jgi:hypothetical protein
VGSFYQRAGASVECQHTVVAGGVEMLSLHKIWVEQCEAARGIENEFGTVPAMKYLVGEKFMSYLDAAEKDADFRAELPAFVAEIKKIFEPWQIAEYLEKAGWTEPFDASLYDEDDEDYDPEEIEMERKDNIRRVAREMLLIERARVSAHGSRLTSEQ